MDHGVRNLLPVGMTLLLVLLSALPTHLPGFAGIFPMLALIGVYYWAIYRPDLLPASMAFCIGLAQDMVMGTPLGVASLVYLLVQSMTASQRKFFLGKPFLVAWSCFALMALAAVLLTWLLCSMLFDHLLPLGPVLFETLMTIAVYPLLSWLFGRTHSALLSGV